MKTLLKSLAAFQQEVPTIHQGTKGYSYTYASLAQILEVINPLLAKHKLGFTQPIENETIKTIIFCTETGESIESVISIPQSVQLKGMNEFQVLGSAITYLRRYSLSSILGLITDKDIDAAGEQKPKQGIDPKVLEEHSSLIASAMTNEELEKVYRSNPELYKKTPSLLKLFTARKAEINKL